MEYFDKKEQELNQKLETLLEKQSNKKEEFSQKTTPIDRKIKSLIDNIEKLEQRMSLQRENLSIISNRLKNNKDESKSEEIKREGRLVSKRIKHLSKDIGARREELSSLQSQGEELNINYGRDNIHLSTQINEVRKELSFLQREKKIRERLEEKVNEEKNLEKEVTRLQKENRELKNEITKLIKELEKLKNQVELNHKELQEHKKEFEKHRREYNQHRQDIDNKLNNITQNNETIEKLESSTNKYQVDDLMVKLQNKIEQKQELLKNKESGLNQAQLDMKKTSLEKESIQRGFSEENTSMVQEEIESLGDIDTKYINNKFTSQTLQMNYQYLEQDKPMIKDDKFPKKLNQLIEQWNELLMELQWFKDMGMDNEEEVLEKEYKEEELKKVKKSYKDTIKRVIDKHTQPKTTTPPNIDNDSIYNPKPPSFKPKR